MLRLKPRISRMEGVYLVIPRGKQDILNCLKTKNTFKTLK